jgi:hypothetical protein
MVNIESNMVGSTMADTVISRLLPMPPKDDPASRPARAMKNLIIPKR